MTPSPPNYNDFEIKRLSGKDNGNSSLLVWITRQANNKKSKNQAQPSPNHRHFRFGVIPLAATRSAAGSWPGTVSPPSQQGALWCGLGRVSPSRGDGGRDGWGRGCSKNLRAAAGTAGMSTSSRSK